MLNDDVQSFCDCSFIYIHNTALIITLGFSQWLYKHSYIIFFAKLNEFLVKRGSTKRKALDRENGDQATSYGCLKLLIFSNILIERSSKCRTTVTSLSVHASSSSALGGKGRIYSQNIFSTKDLDQKDQTNPREIWRDLHVFSVGTGGVK